MAPIKTTNQTDSTLSNNEKGVLLNKKIKESILNDKPIIIGIENPAMECRNTIFPNDYEIEYGKLYINNGNFELHINLDEVEVEYNYDFEDNFIFTYNDTEIRLYFLD